MVSKIERSADKRHRVPTANKRAPKFTRCATFNSRVVILNELVSTATCSAVAPFLNQVSAH